MADISVSEFEAVCKKAEVLKTQKITLEAEHASLVKEINLLTAELTSKYGENWEEILAGKVETLKNFSLEV